MAFCRPLLLFGAALVINFGRTWGICEGTETFERILGVTILSANQIALYSSQNGPVTAECNNRCRRSAACPAYLVNYDRSACYRLDLTSRGRRHLLTPVAGHTAYFEKVCLKTPACSKAWVFDRLPGQELAGLDDLVLERVTSRLQCLEYCLLNHQLPCRSAEYVPDRRLCRISTSDRRTAPLSLQQAPDTDYLENQCAPPADSGGCDWDEQLNSEMAYSDLQLVTTSADLCRRACETTSAFRCRSFTFMPSRSLCRLSAEDTVSAGQLALRQNAAAIFYQRAPCLNLELVCAVDRMTVRLRTEEPFGGRIFALDAPSCQVRGTGLRATEATFRYTDSRCGVVKESAGSYTTLVVIQQHQLIQRRGDRATKLVCTYDTTNRSVSSGLDLLVDRIDGDLVTATVNATAPTPRVSLHVRDTAGDDVTGVQLGQQLFLSLELDDRSIFGMFARSLVAKGGASGESIVLLDDRGCPTEESIFGGFRSRPDKPEVLAAPFEAFKFVDDPVVRFEISVQFCVDRCRPAQCRDGPRRRRASSDLHPVTRQRAIRGEAPLRREMIVDGGRARRSAGGLRPAAGSAEEMVCARGAAVAGGVAALTLIQACLLMVCVACVHRHRRQRLQDELQCGRVSPCSNRRRLGPLQASRPAPLHISTLRRLRNISLRRPAPLHISTLRRLRSISPRR